MNTIRFICTMMLLGAFANLSLAQTATEGLITYEQKINIHAALTGKQAALKSMVPEFSTQLIDLQYSGQKAFLQVSASKEEHKEEGMELKMQTMGSHKIIDLDAKKTYSKVEFDKQSYLVVNDILDKPDAIQLVEGTREILGYACKKALWQREDQELTVWYTTAIKAPFSPMGSLSLDGLVLAIEGERISYTAQRINFQAVDQALLNVPEGLREITAAQFQDLQEELLEEMTGGQGERVIIKNE